MSILSKMEKSYKHCACSKALVGEYLNTIGQGLERRAFTVFALSACMHVTLINIVNTYS